MDETEPTLSDAAFKRKLRYSTYSPVVSLSFLVAALLGLVLMLLNNMRWVDHSNRVIGEALNAEKLLVDVQTATRGYYLTGDAEFLKPYVDSRPELPSAIAGLRELVNDNPEQAKLADAFAANTLDWLKWMGETLAAARVGNSPDVAQLRDGRDRFNDVRKDIDAFLSNEYRLRDERARRTTRATWGALIAGAVLTVIVAAIQCTGMRRRLRAITGTYRDALRLAKERRLRVQGLLTELDRELKAVGEIQRSLLPITLPAIPGLELSASYQTSRRAGGDYYDFFRLPPAFAGDDRPRYGILIADVSGHGTPAAVLMAVTHSIAHGFDQPDTPPNEMLNFVNRRLYDGYTTVNTAFVTAFYAIYDSTSRTLSYSSAGHNPPRLRRANATAFQPLDDAQGMPLGIMREEEYPAASIILEPGDTLVLYTDGITEAWNATGDEMLGVAGLDAAIANAPHDPEQMLEHALAAVVAFSGATVDDDRTLMLIRACDADSGDPTCSTSRQAVIVPEAFDPVSVIKAR